MQEENFAKNLLKDYRVIIDFPVVWGEMDVFKHVNNVHYIRYFESSRIKYFEALNYFPLIDQGTGIILGSISCKYKAPVKYPDHLYVGAKIYRISHDRFWMKYAIVSSESKIITTEGDSVIVSYDYNINKKIPLPEIIKDRILALEKDIIIDQ